MSLTSDPLSSTVGDTAFDPFAHLEDVPYDALAELRAECPVARTPTGWYLSKSEVFWANGPERLDAFLAAEPLG
ncbi:MAG: hypothetical protein OXT07_11600 [bacterium]|nr:hypothetical protein [bacterium]